MFEDKQKRQKRFQQKINHIQKQLKICKKLNFLPYEDKKLKEPHRLAKIKAANCGNPKCVLCGNPRKFLGLLSKQEMSFIQTGEWNEDQGTYSETEKSSGPSCVEA